MRLVRETAGYVEAEVSRSGEGVRVEWARESAYRFFPLLTHPVLGLTLHPFDLAANKVLALVGRLEVRDWIDVLECDARLQPLGYIAWAASAKDPGFSPAAILEIAARTARYSQTEVSALAYAGGPPDAVALSRRWHDTLEEARRLVAVLPASEAGSCVLDERGDLCRAEASALVRAVAEGRVRFHAGTIGGALPRLAG